MTKSAAWRSRPIMRMAGVLAILPVVGVVGTQSGASEPTATSDSGSVSVGASDDTFTTPGQSSPSQGLSPLLLAGDEGLDGRVAYFKFSVPVLPANATSISASLTLHQVGSAQTGSVKVYRVTTDWDQMSVTSAAAPTLDQFVGRAPVAADSTATVVPLVGANVHSGDTVGLAATSVLGIRSAIGFASRESPDLSLQPVLTISYELAPVCTVSDLLVPSCGAWFGSTANQIGSEGSASDAVGRIEAELGRSLDIVHVYHSADQDWPTPTEVALASDPATPRRLLINWKPDNGMSWGQVAAGAQDPWIDTVAARILSRLGSTRFFLAIHHEPENEIQGAGSGFTPSDYVAMFRHVALRLRADGVSNAVLVWDVMGYSGWGDKDLYTQLYPGDDVVDWIGYDPYSHGGLPLTTFADRPDQTFPGFYSWAVSAHPGKPLMLAEFGIESAAAADRVAVFDSLVDEAQTMPALKAFVYFDHGQDATTGPNDYSLESDPTVLAAARAAFDSPYFLH